MKAYKILALFTIIFLTGCVPRSYHRAQENQVGTIADQTLFSWPVSHHEIVPFGAMRDGAALKGVLLSANPGERVIAARDGQVVFVDPSFQGYGRTVILKHPDDFFTVYARDLDVAVKPGQQVRQGELIGTARSGDKGKAPALYFEIRKQSRAEDPMNFLPRKDFSKTV